MKNICICLLGLSISFGIKAATPELQSGFPIHIPNSERTFASSPTITDLNNDNIPEIIFGNKVGIVYAYSSNGNLLWSHDTGNASIESKPAVADLNNDGMLEVVVTAGSSLPFNNNHIGSLTVLNGQNGDEICKYIPSDIPDTNKKRRIYSSPSVANLDDDPQLEIAFGDWGFRVSVLNHDCQPLWQSKLPQAISQEPFPIDTYDETTDGVYVNDTVWSSPAIADINKDGQLDVIIGVDTHIDETGITIDGGRILIINGNDGTLQFAIETDEVIWSSPAIADLDNDGSLDIIVGMGYCWQNFEACAPPPNGAHNVVNKIFAFNAQGQSLPGWPHILESNYALNVNSVAVGDIDSDGFLEVLINAFDTTSNITPTTPAEGKLFAIEHTGNTKWGVIPNVPAGQTNHTHYAAGSASPIIADITGDGDFEVVVPSNWELVVYNKNGAQISRQVPNNIDPNAFTLLGNFPFLSTPNVTDLDGDGDLEIVAIGGSVAIAPRPSSIWAWDLTTSSSNFQPWTSFRNSVQNLGNFIKKDPIFINGFEND